VSPARDFELVFGGFVIGFVLCVVLVFWRRL